MVDSILIVYGILVALAVADAGFSRLTRTAKALWMLILVFVPVVGVLAWGLTRHTAYQPAPIVPPGMEDEPAPEGV